ncbi:MAG: hypothetical protein ACI8TP_001002 [Acidimicrobiales bacterium]|jgi:hypothetical protein
MGSENLDFDRQQQIWTGLYGPSTSADLVEKARQHRASHPDLAIREVFRAIEPSDEDDDPDEAGMARPGVG